MYAKISVKGGDKPPLYKFLTGKQANPTAGGEIEWNFTKFLVGRDGKVVGAFRTGGDAGIARSDRSDREGPKITARR